MELRSTLPGVAVIDQENSWHERAACRMQDPELFYPSAGTTDSPEARKALKICAACPVREACLEDALARRERHGIWGGTSPEQRVAMLRARRNLAARRAVAEQEWPLAGLTRRSAAARVGEPRVGEPRVSEPRVSEPRVSVARLGASHGGMVRHDASRQEASLPEAERYARASA